MEKTLKSHRKQVGMSYGKVMHGDVATFFNENKKYETVEIPLYEISLVEKNNIILECQNDIIGVKNIPNVRIIEQNEKYFIALGKGYNEPSTKLLKIIGVYNSFIDKNGRYEGK